MVDGGQLQTTRGCQLQGSMGMEQHTVHGGRDWTHWKMEEDELEGEVAEIERIGKWKKTS
jgi:hypothetical protein